MGTNRHVPFQTGGTGCPAANSFRPQPEADAGLKQALEQLEQTRDAAVEASRAATLTWTSG